MGPTAFLKYDCNVHERFEWSVNATSAAAYLLAPGGAQGPWYCCKWAPLAAKGQAQLILKLQCQYHGLLCCYPHCARWCTMAPLPILAGATEPPGRKRRSTITTLLKVSLSSLTFWTSLLTPTCCVRRGRAGQMRVSRKHLYQNGNTRQVIHTVSSSNSGDTPPTLFVHRAS